MRDSLIEILLELVVDWKNAGINNANSYTLLANRTFDAIAIVRQHQAEQSMQDDDYEVANSRRSEKSGVDIDDLLPDEPRKISSGGDGKPFTGAIEWGDSRISAGNGLPSGYSDAIELVRELHDSMKSEAGIHYLECDLGERVEQFLGSDIQREISVVDKLSAQAKAHGLKGDPSDLDCRNAFEALCRNCGIDPKCYDAWWGFRNAWHMRIPEPVSSKPGAAAALSKAILEAHARWQAEYQGVGHAD